MGFALALYWSSGAGGAPPAEATQGASNTASLSIGACTGPKCNVPQNTTFVVNVNVLTWTIPYDGIDIIVDTDAGGPSIGAPKSANCSAWTTGHNDVSSVPSSTRGEVACYRGISDPSSTQKGKIGEIVVNCTQSGTLAIDASSQLPAGSGNPAITGSPLQVNCTPSTPTPLPAPGMEKCVEYSGGCTNFTNFFLTSNSPPTRCQDMDLSQLQILWERLTSPVLQNIAAWSFELRYDPKLVCVAIFHVPPPQGAGQEICTKNDDVHNGPLPPGIAHISCVVLGKGVRWDDTQPLGIIGIAPQAETVRQLRPNQNNGVFVVADNQDCYLADDQGTQIRPDSCADAFITFRFLEGDIVPNCAVDVADTQDISFRWGAQKGSLLYKTFDDVSPSGPVQGDGRIDLADVQFVFGRYGSTCANPHPPQPPQSP